MDDVEVDAVLNELGGSVAEFIADIAAAERDVDAWSEEDELFITRPRDRSDARRAVVSLRYRVTVATARELRTAGRELVVWWADLATHAVLAAARGVPVDAALAAAVEPGRFLSDDELDRLPAVPETERLLVGLATRMGPSPMGARAPGDDLPALARKRAARAGLMVRHLPDGEAEIVDDPTEEGRRCRLWGDLWVDYKLPGIPPADWIAEVLATAGVGAAVVQEVREVASAVDGMRAAAARLEELNSAEESDEPAMDEFDALWERLDPATDVLAKYAAVLTRHLPTIRYDFAAATRR
ncbi:MAG TPA: hypothetical protein VFO16_08435 [Pseudonocardiaceae bacterium]|nr:hypothetical protein [Pseudonocardiaceae bacterium]